MYIKEISWILIVCAGAIFFVLGDPDSFKWTSFDFTVQSLTIALMSYLILKSYRGKLFRILMQGVMGVSIVKLALNLYSFFDVEVFNKINRSYEAGAILVVCIIIFSIYKRYGRMV